MSTKTAGNGWDRIELTVRLSRRRREQLRKVAERLSTSATPTDAIDHALASFLSTESAPPDRFADLEDAIDRSAMERRFEMDRVEEALLKLGERLDSLCAVIAAAASSQD